MRTEGPNDPTARGATMRALLLLAAFVVVGAAIWSLSDTTTDSPAPLAGTTPTGSTDDAETETAGRSPATRDQTSRTVAEAGTGQPPAAPDDEWVIQLVGLRPGVPWSTPLHATIEDRLEVFADVDASGACRFVPPAGARNPGLQHVRFTTRDANYRLRNRHHRTATLQRTGRMELFVDPVANLRGRVLDPDGNGCAARVRAYSFDGTAPREPMLGRTLADEDGHYDLQVPPGARVLVVADALEFGSSPLVDIGQSFVTLGATGPTRDDFEDLGRPIHRSPRLEWLPAWLRTEATFQHRVQVQDLQLQRAATLSGRVTLPDGKPFGDAIVTATPSGITEPAWSGRLHWYKGTSLVRGDWNRTDPDGTYVLYVTPAVPFDMLATATRPLMLAGEPSAIATAPDTVHFAAPGQIVTIRVTHDGKPAKGARIELGEVVWHADADGLMQVTLKPEPIEVQASLGVLTSERTTIPASGRPDTIDLAVEAHDLCDVQLTVRSRPAMLRARFVWRPSTEGQALTLTAQRANAEEPFRMQVPAGAYTLSVLDSTASSAGSYVLENRNEVSVTPSGTSKTIDLAFGGSIQIDLHAANRTRLGGTFTLTSSAGQDVTGRTIAWDADGIIRVGETGRLQPIGSNRIAEVLQPGDYTLTVTTDRHGTATRTVTVTAGSNTKVAIELR